VAATADEVVSGLRPLSPWPTSAAASTAVRWNLRAMDDANLPKRTGENTRAMIDSGEVSVGRQSRHRAHRRSAQIGRGRRMPLICPVGGASSLHGSSTATCSTSAPAIGRK